MIAVVALFASAQSAVSSASALAPVKLGLKKSGNALVDQSNALWPQFERTAAALDQAILRAQASKTTQLERDELKTMITLRLRLREMGSRQGVSRDDLETIFKELEDAQEMARGDHMTESFAGFRQQANQMEKLLASLMRLMDEANLNFIQKNSV